MIELTEKQALALEHSQAQPPRVLNPRTQRSFVLVSVEEYERLTQDDYDDGPWADQEIAVLAAEAGVMLDSFRKDP